VEVLPLPVKYFRQFPKKGILVENKTPIEKEVCTKDILDRILEEEMKITLKKL